MEEKKKKGLTIFKLIVIFFVLFIIIYGIFVINKNNRKVQKGMKIENKVVYREKDMNQIFIQPDTNMSINMNMISGDIVEGTDSRAPYIDDNEVEVIINTDEEEIIELE